MLLNRIEICYEHESLVCLDNTDFRLSQRRGMHVMLSRDNITIL